MASSATRYQIVSQALTRAGRDIGLRTLAEPMLNAMLRKWALEYRYPSLRKTGSVITLPQGSQSCALPSDFGAGGDSLMIGPARLPIYERMNDEFVQYGGYQPGTGYAQGMPTFYTVDKFAGNFVFNTIADQNYDVLPIYFAVPADIPTPDATGDATKVWVDDDELVIQGLIQMIYQYTQDTREAQQAAYVEKLKGDWRRGSVPIGGGMNKVIPSRQVFKRRSSR